jgi:integrase
MLTTPPHNDRHLQVEGGAFMAARQIGHVRWFRSRRRWYIDLYYNGKRHHIYSYQGVTFKQKDYAEDVLTLIRGEIATKTFDIRKYKKGAQLTVSKYAETWLEGLSLSPATIKDYSYSIRKYIGPYFEAIDIRDVRHSHLLDFKNWLSKKRAPKGVYNVMNCLKAILRYAHRNEDIKQVPPFPKLEYQKPPIRWLDETAQIKVIETIPKDDQHIFWFMKWYGVRPSEARALQKSDILLEHITIQHSFSLNKLIKTTKTHRVKVLPKTAQFNTLLNEMPRRLSPFVFTRSWDNKPYTQKNLNKLWNEACQKVGVDINLYNGLKHSLGMHLLEKGVPKELVQKIYGHSKSEMTDRYCEYQTEQMKVALESFSNIVQSRNFGQQNKKT